MQESNIDNLSSEQLEKLIAEISAKVIENINEACDKSNQLLNRYGMEVKMEVAILPKE